MTKDIVKQRIVDYIKKNGSITYSEIEDVEFGATWGFSLIALVTFCAKLAASGYKWEGRLSTCSDMNQNVIFWEGWNDEALKALNLLTAKSLKCAFSPTPRSS